MEILSQDEHGCVSVVARLMIVCWVVGPVQKCVPAHRHTISRLPPTQEKDPQLVNPQSPNPIPNPVYGYGAAQELPLQLLQPGMIRKSFAERQAKSENPWFAFLCRAHTLKSISIAPWTADRSKPVFPND